MSNTLPTSELNNFRRERDKLSAVCSERDEIIGRADHMVDFAQPAQVPVLPQFMRPHNDPEAVAYSRSQRAFNGGEYIGPLATVTPIRQAVAPAETAPAPIDQVAAQFEQPQPVVAAQPVEPDLLHQPDLNHDEIITRIEAIHQDMNPSFGAPASPQSYDPPGGLRDVA